MIVPALFLGSILLLIYHIVGYFAQPHGTPSPGIVCCKQTVSDLLNVLNGPSSKNRCLAASILSKLWDGDSEPQRDTVGAALTAPDTYPRLLAAFKHQDSQTAAAVANLLSKILHEEQGMESLSYNNNSNIPPPPSPLKDKIVTSDLIHHAIRLINQPELAKEALSLVCLCCWGYPRGFDLVQASFASYVPEADVFFFASLDSEYQGKHVSRQRRRVAEAAVKAGAISRVVKLLESEVDSIKAGRVAVEGVRVLLSAESADKDIDRSSKRLPSVLAALVADKTKESLERVLWMLKLLVNDEDQSWILKWGDFGNAETVGQLVEILYSFSYARDPERNGRPVCTPENGAEYTTVLDAYQDIIIDSQEQCEVLVSRLLSCSRPPRLILFVSQTISRLTGLVVEIINCSLPVLSPHTAPLLGALLVLSSETPNNYAILETLNILAALNSDNANSLSIAAKELLASNPPSSPSQFGDWVRSGSALSMAFRQASLAGYLLNIIAGAAQEDEERHADQLAAFSALAALVEKTEDRVSKREIQKSFFGNERALATLCGLPTMSIMVPTLRWPCSNSPVAFQLGYKLWPRRVF